MTDPTYGYRTTGKTGVLTETTGLTLGELLTELACFQRKAYWRFVNDGETRHHKGTTTLEII